MSEKCQMTTYYAYIISFTQILYTVYYSPWDVMRTQHDFSGISAEDTQAISISERFLNQIERFSRKKKCIDGL